MKKTYRYQTNNSETRPTTKKYIERIYETKEAEQEIKQYENCPDELLPSRQDGKRLKRS